MQRNEHLEATLRENKLVGGTVDRHEPPKHWVIYWSINDHKLIQVSPKTSRSTSGIRNTVSEIRRQARALA